MRQQRSAGVGLGLALLSAVTFSTSGTFARSLFDAGWSAEAAVAARVGVAALLLAVPAALSLRGNWHVLRRNLGMIAVFGLLAVAGAQACFFNAVRYLPIGVALLLEYLGILLVVGWMWVAHGQRPRRLTVAGSAAAVLGLVFVLDLAGGHLDPVGVLWGLVPRVGLAAYFVLSARGDRDLPSTAMASGGMAVGAGALLALGAAGTLPLHATFGAVSSPATAPAGSSRSLACRWSPPSSPTSPASARPGSWARGCHRSSASPRSCSRSSSPGWCWASCRPRSNCSAVPSSWPASRWSASTNCGRHRPGACPMLVGQNRLWLGRRNKTEVRGCWAPRALASRNAPTSAHDQPSSPAHPCCSEQTKQDRVPTDVEPPVDRVAGNDTDHARKDRSAPARPD